MLRMRRILGVVHVTYALSIRCGRCYVCVVY